MRTVHALDDRRAIEIIKAEKYMRWLERMGLVREKDDGTSDTE